LRSIARISGLNIVIQPGVSGPVTVELESVPWDQALDQILKINQLGMELDGNILRIAPVARLAQEAEEQQRLTAAKSLSLPLTTVMRRVSYADAQEIASILQRGRGGTGLMSQRASVIVDNRTNTLIIQELPAYMDQVISIIENLDIPEDQVMIEARIVETTKNWSRSLGFNWNVEGVAGRRARQHHRPVFPNNVSGAQDKPTATAGTNLLTGGANGFLDIGLGNILNTFELDVVLNAAENEGLVNVISAPKVATLNNERASIQSGLQIPVQTVANNTVTVQFVNATLRLDVTPHITAEGTVLLEINIQKREPQQGLAVVGAPSAPIATRDARTRVLVRDGGTAVIGGIYEVSTDESQDRVPGLANIPILGHLFKNKNRSNTNEELLIFITPRIIHL
jgi:type IV pilus assembly protein PilQ